MGDAKLPPGWAWGTVRDTGDYVNGVAFKPADWGDRGKPIIRIQNLTDPSKPFNRTERQVDRIYDVSNGDLLVSWSATLDAFLWHREDALLNQHIFKVYPAEGLVSKSYLFYLLGHLIREMKLTEDLHGTTMKHINRGPFLAFPTPIAPAPEQRRIVAKIEQLFSNLDKGVEALKAAKEQLKRYRQAVLKAAFTGKLTEAWRKAALDKPDSTPRGESAEELLGRLRPEQTRASARRTAGRTAQSLDVSRLPQLPIGWVWTRVGDIGLVSGGLTKNPKRSRLRDQLPYLRVANVYAGRLDLCEIKTIGVKPTEMDKVRLEVGDMLVVEGNGSIDQVGRVALWDGTIDGCVHQNHIIKVRFNLVGIGQYVMPWLLSPDGRRSVMQVASSTTGLHTLSISKVTSLPVPLCSLGEQRQIVLAVERSLSLANMLEAEVTASIARSTRLRQSILKRAFEGKLVPQDPTDEPAEKLLERIRAEREARAGEAKAAKKARKPKPKRKAKKARPTAKSRSAAARKAWATRRKKARKKGEAR